MAGIEDALNALGIKLSLMDAARMAQAGGQAGIYGLQDINRGLTPGGRGFTPNPQEEAARELRIQELLSGTNLSGSPQLGPYPRPGGPAPRRQEPQTSPVSWGSGPSTGPQRPPQRPPQPQQAGPTRDRPWLSEEGYGPLTGSTNPEADAILRAMTEERMLRAEFERNQRAQQAREIALEEQALQQRLEGLGVDPGPSIPGLTTEYGFVTPGQVKQAEEAARINKRQQEAQEYGRWLETIQLNEAAEEQALTGQFGTPRERAEDILALEALMMEE